MKTPRKYQQDAIDLGISRNTLIADDRGLGKTLMGIEIGAAMAGLPRLIICNKTSRLQWKEEILDQYPDDNVIIFEEPIVGKRYQEDGLWVICHHWQVSNFNFAFNNTLWGMVCLDEAHRIKNRDTRIANSIKHIETTRKIALTGTPVEHGPRDFFSVLQWLYPQYYTSLWDFVQKHCELEKKWTPNGMKKKTTGKCLNPDLLAYELSPFTIRRTKAEVAPQLPPKNIMRIPVAMNEKQQKYYDIIDKADDVEVKIGNEVITLLNRMAQFTMLHQIASAPIAAGFDIISSRISWLADYIDDNPNTRFIILSRYRKIAEFVSLYFGTALVIGGKEIGLSDFKSGKMKHITGTIGAMAESLSLDMADCIVFIDQDYNAIMMDQAQDRHHRMTTTTQKDVIMLYTPGTVDDLVLGCIDGKFADTELIYKFIQRHG